MKCGYIQVHKDGSLGDRLLNPDWRNDAGELITDDKIFIAHGYRPLYDEIPDHDPDLQRVRGLERKHWIVEPDRVKIAYSVIDKTPEDVYVDLTEQIDADREARKFCGTVEWTRPETGEAIPVDLRSEADIVNLQTVLTLAEDGPVEFRDAENTLHSLSPDDAREMVKSALRHVQSCNREAWTRKDELKVVLQSKTQDKASQLVARARGKQREAS